MASKIHVKKDDKVVVISGKDAGAQGQVLKTEPKSGRVVVSGVNMIKKHQKAMGQNKPAGIIEKEGSIDASNVMYLHKGKPTRIGFRIEGGKKVRVADVWVLQQVKEPASVTGNRFPATAHQRLKLSRGANVRGKQVQRPLRPFLLPHQAVIPFLADQPGSPDLLRQADIGIVLS